MHAGHGLHVDHDLALEAADAASLNEGEDWQQECAAPDEDEMQNFVKDGRAQAAEADVNGNRNGGDEDAEADIPAQYDLHDHGHGEHVDAAHEDHFDGEGEGGDAACRTAEAQVEIARDRVRFAHVIEGHHDQAKEDHGGDGTDPIPVSGEDAVLVS